MKILLTLLLATLIQTNSCGQIVPVEKGDIKVEVSTFNFKRTKNDELTRKTIKTGLGRYFFDTKGNLSEEVHYGKHHNNSLKLLDRVEQYYYSNGQLTQSKQWDTDYEKNILYSYYTNYTYDSAGRIVDEVTYTDRDSVFMHITFEYPSGKSITRFGKSQTTIREYDKDKKLVSKKQLWDNDTKTNWIIRYSYKENCVIEDFGSYYDDSVRDYSKKKTACYENSRLVEIIEYYVDKDRLNEKKTFVYGPNGFLDKIEIRRYSSTYQKYEFESFIQIKIQSQDHSEGTIEKVNKKIIELVIG
jgi:hypothetical protein